MNDIEYNFKGKFESIEEDSLPGFMDNIVASRVSNYHNIQGTNAVYDHGMDSFSVALNQGILSLQNGENDIIIVGAVNGNVMDEYVEVFRNYSKSLSFETEIKSGACFYVVKRSEDVNEDDTVLGTFSKSANTKFSIKAKSYDYLGASEAFELLNRLQNNCEKLFDEKVDTEESKLLKLNLTYQLLKTIDVNSMSCDNPVGLTFEESDLSIIYNDVEDLKTLYGTVFSGDAQQYNMLSKAGKVTYASLPGYELMGKPISSSSDTDFAKFIKALKATDWVRSGHTHFAGQTDGKCPYCQQKLPSNFDKEIAACFDAQYQDDISAINAFQRTYESEMDSVVATLEGNVSAAMPELDLSEYEVKVQLLVDAITINKQRIAAKIKEPTSIASLEDTDSLLIEIGTLIDGFNKKIKENNEIVRDLKTKKVLCKKQVWEYLAELLKADVAAYNKALSDLDTEIKALKDKMEQLKKDATAKKKEANELNKQIVNTEATIDSINVLLDNSGFEGFHLRAKDGVANTYEVIRPDGTVAEKLSEGERNFIAFLYYYHLVKGSLNSEAVKDKIVVIDDPVSSMDSGALFIVSALVREMIEVCYNNTDYRSHKVDGDYIKQIFILTHNVYFHKEITHHQAKRYHSVSFYMIRKIENISSVKLCVRQSQRVPTEQENYNPIQNSYAALWDEYKELKTANTVKNVIRHILEYYFIQICGYEGNDLHKIVLEQNKLLFVDEVEGQKPNYDRYNLASSMLTYMNDGPAVISDGFNYIDDGSDVEQCKKVFELIFTAMHQEQHYKMMMGIED